MSSVRSFKQAVMPIIWLNCIFCMGIFEIPVNRRRYYLSAFYVISMLTGYFILFYKNIEIFQEVFVHEFMVFNYVLGVNILVALWAILLYWCKLEKVYNIIKKNNLADNTLQALGIKSGHQKIFYEVLYLLTFWIAGMISVMVIYVTWVYNEIEFWDIIFSVICLSVPIMTNSVVDLTFALLIRCVQIKIRKINTLINNIVLSANESNNFKIYNRHSNASIAFIMTKNKIHKENIIHLIYTLRQLHLEIMRLGKQTNRAYCLVLLLELAVHFTVVTAVIYSLYSAFSGKIRVDNGKIIAMAMTGCIYSFKIIIVNWLCSSVSIEAHKTCEIIQTFEGSVLDDDMREEIQQFTHQIELRPLKFSASGFFPIDNALTGKFFSTVATYVVILIQLNTFVHK